MKITQAVLRKVMKQRVKVEAESAKLKAAEDKVFLSLKAGAAVQAGMLIAEIKRIERRNVAQRLRNRFPSEMARALESGWQSGSSQRLSRTYTNHCPSSWFSGRGQCV
jgi:hypothetical protein